MSKFISLAFAALAAVSSFASGDTPVEWYTPGGFEQTTQSGQFLIKNKVYDVYLGEDGQIYAYGEVPKKLTQAEENALIALEAAWVAQKQVETLADTMYDHAAIDLEFEPSKTGGGGTFTWKVAGNSGGGGGATVESRYYKVVKNENAGTYDFYENNTKKISWSAFAGAVDNKSVELKTKTEGDELQISGWNDGYPANTLSDVLKNEEEDPVNRYTVIVRQESTGKLQYWTVGYGLGGGEGNSADGMSITTNTSDGAVYDGKSSLYGYSTAEGGSVPMKFEDGLLWWNFGPGFVFNEDDATVGVGAGRGICFEPGYDMQEKIAANLGLGLVFEGSDDDAPFSVHIGAGLGYGDVEEYGACPIELERWDDGYVRGWDGNAWHTIDELQVVDQESIVTNDSGSVGASVNGFASAGLLQVPFKGEDSNGKRIMWTSTDAPVGSLLSRGRDAVEWTSTDSRYHYYGTDKNGGEIGWFPLPQVNSNGFVNVDGISVDTNNVGELQIAGFDKMNGGYLVKSGGKVKSQFFIATNGISRTETAGELNLSSTIGLENWDDPSGTCAEHLGGILTGQIHEADGDHYVLTRHKSGKLHYTKIGRVPNVPPDGVTITTNNAGAAENKLAIAGAYDDANIGKVLSSTGSGTAWIAAVGGSPVDNASITTNYSNGATADGTASVYGFRTAASNSILYKDGNKTAWIDPPSGESALSPKFLAINESAFSWVDIGAGGGSALAFYGNDGTSVTTPVVVGSGAFTNAVKFASAYDSNVKVQCASDGAGGVTVTIGVYYK